MQTNQTVEQPADQPVVQPAGQAQPRRGRPPKRSGAELAEFIKAITADYEAGMSVLQIAIKHREGESYVYRRLTQAGVPRRPRGGSKPNPNRY